VLIITQIEDEESADYADYADFILERLHKGETGRSPHHQYRHRVEKLASNYADSTLRESADYADYADYADVILMKNAGLETA
jgi:hypothetical protein